MDLDDIQDGEVYAVEESKHDDGTTARLSVEADGAIVAHLRAVSYTHLTLPTTPYV